MGGGLLFLLRLLLVLRLGSDSLPNTHSQAVPLTHLPLLKPICPLFPAVARRRLLSWIRLQRVRSMLCSLAGGVIVRDLLLVSLPPPALTLLM